MRHRGRGSASDAGRGGTCAASTGLRGFPGKVTSVFSPVRWGFGASFQRCCDGQMTFSHGPWAPTTYLGLRPRRKDAAAEPVRGRNVWSPTFICGLLTPPSRPGWQEAGPLGGERS